jgi:hypothetical protein
MENPTTTIPSISFILKQISDDKALTLFNSIAVSDGHKYIPLREMNITTKQYYSRMSGLIDAGLIRRHKGKYSLTLLGKIIYDTQTMIGKTLSYYWKLKAIEAIEMYAASDSSGLPKEELAQLVDILIDNHNVKDILMKSISICVPSEIKSTIVKAATPSMEQKITI